MKATLLTFTLCTVALAAPVAQEGMDRLTPSSIS